MSLLEIWKERCDTDPEIWDQVVLQQILEENRVRRNQHYRVAELPVSFCWIFDRLSNAKTDAVDVEQLQAGRQAKPKRKIRRNKILARRKQRIAIIEQILAPMMNSNMGGTPSP